MDNKGRILMPAPLKKQLMPVLEEGFVIKRSVFQKCLELYPMKEWNEVMAGVNSLNRFVKKNNDFIRMFTAGVKVVELDGASRLNITKDLVTYAGLNNNIVMSSAVNMIEIWDKDAYEKALNNPDLDFGALAEEVMGKTKGDELP
jgi:MraZ protein